MFTAPQKTDKLYDSLRIDVVFCLNYSARFLMVVMIIF